ncbi:MAG: proline--tRNA ligase, partial [Alphaproteobacteria bacterium]|nr:proline--tRNA ligase [Alphaproteobacteria bacterium]
LQAGTSHYLGENFSRASGIQFQDKEGGQTYCHTTSWGVSTRMVGAVIMTHGDDDGLRVPPQIAPWQVVILPMLRDKPEDEALLAYCEELRGMLVGQSAFGEKLRVLLDTKPGKAAAKRWDWVRKGAPVIVEVGGRDMEQGVVSLLRRDGLWDASTGKPAFQNPSREGLGEALPAMLDEIQSRLLAQAQERREANIIRDVTEMAAVEAHFAEDQRYPGWLEVQWSKPTGAALDAVVERLKALKLTVRNVPVDAAPADGACIFTGEPAVERVLLARAY